jgi:hypothetical protein
MGDFEESRWVDAIKEADAWGDGLKKSSDVAPLVELLRSGSPMPQCAQKLLGDLLSRHSLTKKVTLIPFDTKQKSQSEIDALVYKEYADEFKSQPRWPRGPITRAEIDEAVKVMQQRAKANGRGWRDFYGKAAAIKLREERVLIFANYYNLDYKKFKRAVEGKDGSINRYSRLR